MHQIFKEQKEAVKWDNMLYFDKHAYNSQGTLLLQRETKQYEN